MNDDFGFHKKFGIRAYFDERLKSLLIHEDDFKRLSYHERTTFLSNYPGVLVSEARFARKPLIKGFYFRGIPVLPKNKATSGKFNMIESN